MKAKRLWAVPLLLPLLLSLLPGCGMNPLAHIADFTEDEMTAYHMGLEIRRRLPRRCDIDFISIAVSEAGAYFMVNYYQPDLKHVYYVVTYEDGAAVYEKFSSQALARMTYAEINGDYLLANIVVERDGLEAERRWKITEAVSKNWKTAAGGQHTVGYNP